MFESHTDERGQGQPPVGGWGHPFRLDYRPLSVSTSILGPLYYYWALSPYIADRYLADEFFECAFLGHDPAVGWWGW